MTLGSKCECPGCTHVGGIKQAANVAGNFEGLSLLSLCIVWVGNVYNNIWIMIERCFLFKVTPRVPSKQHVCEGFRCLQAPEKNKDCKDGPEDQPKDARSMDYEHDLIFLKEIGSSATQPGVLRSTCFDMVRSWLMSCWKMSNGSHWWLMFKGLVIFAVFGHLWLNWKGLIRKVLWFLESFRIALLVDQRGRTEWILEAR